MMESRYGLAVSISCHPCPTTHMQPFQLTTHTNQPQTNTMPQLSSRSRNQKVGRLFSKWMNLRQWRLFKFAFGEDPFDIFDVLLEQEAKEQFRIEEHSRYSTGSRAKYRDGDASAIFEEDLKEESPWLNDAKFKDKYHLTRSSFWLIVALINIILSSRARRESSRL